MSDMVYEISEYFKQVNDALKEHQGVLERNPPREVTLLRAMKAFMPEESHANADRLIDMMLLARTFEGIGQEEVRASSVHPDGVYDIDSACVAHKKNMNGVMLVALAAMAQRA